VIHWLLNLLFQHRDIVVDGKLYLRRWYLWGRGTAHQVFLHCILLSDAGRELHDHPWAFRTIGLSGCYLEVIPGNRVGGTMLPWRSWAVPAGWTHRVVVMDGPVWTLVIAGRAERTWGFWHAHGHARRWVDWRTHLGLPLDTPDWPEDLVRVAASVPTHRHYRQNSRTAIGCDAPSRIAKAPKN